MALFNRDELESSTIAQLKVLAKDNEIEIEKGWKKGDLVDALARLNGEDDEEEVILDEEEEDIELDDEEDEVVTKLAADSKKRTAAYEAMIESDEQELEPELPEEEDDIEPAPTPKRGAAKAKGKAKEEAEGETLAAKQVATILSKNLGTAVDAKTLRQFFRSPASTVEAVGSGGRYEFAAEDVPQIEREFKAWKEGHASRGTKRTGGKRGSSNQVIEEVEEVEEIELEDEEPDLDEEFDEDELELEEED